MNNVCSGNICTRCGRERIVTKTYKVKVDKSFVTYTITACPDKECQKIVEGKLKEEDRKRVLIKDEQERRALERQKNLADRKKEDSE